MRFFVSDFPEEESERPKGPPRDKYQQAGRVLELGGAAARLFGAFGDEPELEEVGSVLDQAGRRLPKEGRKVVEEKAPKVAQKLARKFTDWLGEPTQD